jgi:hypothetical protein
MPKGARQLECRNGGGCSDPAAFFARTVIKQKKAGPRANEITGQPSTQN